LPLIHFLREACKHYKLEVSAIYCETGAMQKWPPPVSNDRELYQCLKDGGHLLPLPTESAALAHIIEVSLVKYLITQLNSVPHTHARAGTTRAYPDIIVGGERFGGGRHAVDIKVARRSSNGESTENAISLLTGNTFFLHDLLFPGMDTLYSEYQSHLDILMIYTFDETLDSHIVNPELVIHETWRLASKYRSSSTREYIGAVTSLERLRSGQGDFASMEKFLEYWRQPGKFKAVSNRMLREAKERTGNRNGKLFD
jgi:Restriction endonuclease EcoRV